MSRDRESSSSPLRILETRLHADPSRVVLRPFHLGWQANSADGGRARALDCHNETCWESCTRFFTTMVHRNTTQAQRANAAEQGHERRRDFYDAVLTKLDDGPA